MSENEKENLHVGHRQRLISKFLASPENLPDHELLEILLFYAIPRRDTNALAHKILRVFGNLTAVFNASEQELQSVEGVGKSAAAIIVLFGKMFSRVYTVKDELDNISKFTFQTNKFGLIRYFREVSGEKFILLLLDKNFRRITHITFSESNAYTVNVNAPELAKAFAAHSPTYVVLAHNHPSGDLTPSKNDDLATAKINAICSLHGVTLLDHIICTRDDAFSYHYSARLDDIKKNYDITKFFGAV